MKGGKIEYNFFLHKCDCGGNTEIIWHYIRGTANKINYFVKCSKCGLRTVDRNSPKGAIESWDNKQYRK